MHTYIHINGTENDWSGAKRSSCSDKYLNMYTVSMSKTEIGCLLVHDRVRNLSQRSIVCNCASMRVLMCVQHSMSDQLHKDTQF